MKQSKNKKYVLIYSFILVSSAVLHLGCGHIAYSEEQVMYYKKPTPVYHIGHSYYSSPKPYYPADAYEDKMAMWKMEQEKRNARYKEDSYVSYSDMSYAGPSGKCVAWDDYGTCLKKSF